MDNLLDISQDQCFSQLDSYYILQNSFINKSNELSFKYFNISGQLEGENNNLNISSNNDLNLIAKILNEEEYDMNCKIYHITGNNYTINCNKNNKIDVELDLDNSMGCVNNQLLLINFGNNTSNITLNKNEEIRTYFKNKSDGLSGGAIAAIVIASVVALAATIGVIYYLKKINITKETHPISEMKNSVDVLNSTTKINN